MAYIKERGGFWRAEVRRKGYKPVYRAFDTQKQAQQWTWRIEAEIDTGTHIDRFEVASITGHRSMQMFKRYTHLKPEILLARLG